MFRRLLPALVLFAGVGVTAVAGAAPPRIAVVEVETAMNATEHWKKIVAVLQKERLDKQSKLEAMQKELKAKKDKLDAQKAVSDPKITSKQEELLYKDAQELTQGFMKTQKELSDREKKATDSMLSRVEVIVREIAIKEDFDFVFEAGAGNELNVLYAPKTSNITQKVIEGYNKRFKDKPIDL